MARTELLQLRLTKDEMAQILDDAKSHGLSLASYSRMVLLRAKIQVNVEMRNGTL